MHNPFLIYLKSAFGILVVSYLLLVVGTIYLASYQTELSAKIRNTEGTIGQLEARYYTAIAALDATNPGILGFSAPSTKFYARAAQAPVLTRAN